MSSRFVKRGTTVLIRGFRRAFCTKPNGVRGRIESQYFHGVLASRPQYYVGKLSSVQVDTVSKAVQTFLEASPLKLDNALFTDVAHEAPEFSSTTVKALLLKLHSLMMEGDAKEVRGLAVPAQYALCQRAAQLIECEQSLELEFTFADLFFRTYYARLFAERILPRQASALKYLTVSDVVQHLFFCLATRALPIETRAAVPAFVENAIEQLDVEEVALICSALYLDQYRLPNVEHWLKVVDVLERHEGPVPNVALGTFAKYVRYLTPNRRSEYRAVERFLNVAWKRHKEMSLQVHLRIAIAGTQTQLGNEEVSRSAMPKLMAQLDTARTKDIASCLYAHACFDYRIYPSDALAIMKRLKNVAPGASFHESVVKATYSLVVMGYYDEELLIKSLDREIIDFETTHSNVGFDALCLFNVCKLMFPHLLGDKILMTQKDFRKELENVLRLMDLAKRYAKDLKDLQTLIEETFHVETRLVQTSELFPHRDVHIGKDVVVVLHIPRFYSQGRLLGTRKFRTTLIKAAKYNVVELHMDFLQMSRPNKVNRLQRLLAEHLT